MAQAQLHIDLDALCDNWRGLDRLSGTGVQTAATVKADAYGLGVEKVALSLARAGARSFFVAIAEEGARLRAVLGPDLAIHVYAGHMAGDAPLIRDAGLIPMINSPAQLERHLHTFADAPFGIQLDSGMNRLGMEPDEWRTHAAAALEKAPVLIMSHLACADESDHPMNAQQLTQFQSMTDGLGVPRSLAATGGVLLGPAYHFDLTRPGIGLYGARPYGDARPVVRLSIPVIQTRDLVAGETVGYANSFVAPQAMKIATIAAGYADGVQRALSHKATLWHGATRCPLVGRVSMDLLTVDVSGLANAPQSLDLLGPHQGVDDLADLIGTIGYEILTSLGGRYARRYQGA